MCCKLSGLAFAGESFARRPLNSMRVTMGSLDESAAAGSDGGDEVAANDDGFRTRPSLSTVITLPPRRIMSA